MKSVTEFLNHKLNEGIQAKTALASEGKSAEEISAALGEKFKLEGDKLKYFVNAVEIAGAATEKLFRVKVVRLNEGQNPPPRGTVIEDVCYIAEPQTNLADLKKPEPKAETKDARGGRSGGGGRGGKPGGPGGKGGGKPKASPWGISPEEKEAKAAAARQSAREKSLAAKK
jgi:hypothetical protein